MASKQKVAVTGKLGRRAEAAHSRHSLAADLVCQRGCGWVGNAEVGQVATMVGTPAKQSTANNQDFTSNLGFLAKLWLTVHKGRICDCVHGSGSMIVQSEEFVESQSEKLGDFSVYVQGSSATPHCGAVMQLDVRGIDPDFGLRRASTFRCYIHPDLRASVNKHG